MNEKNNKILVHACCAICSGYPIQYLRELGHEPIIYFFNPNIYPESEYLKRLEAQERLCNALNCELIVGEYGPHVYTESMLGFETHREGSERCAKCFELRLLKTVQVSETLEIYNFTTTLSVSPHKNFNVIKEVAKSVSNDSSINFIDIDFKKQNGFLKTRQIAKGLDLYMQNYCGCEMSMQK